MSLDEIKSIELKTLLYLDSFCKKHDIKYFVCAGTLLGAVRHGGFIPWDDDVDVAMLRSDYEKFKSVFTDNEGKYYLLDPEKNPLYLYPFLKLCDRSTLIEERITRHSGVVMGVNIDIFPLDYIEENEEIFEQQQEKIDMYRSLATFVLNGAHQSSGIKKVFAMLADHCIHVVGKSQFTRAIIRESRKISKNHSNKVACLNWLYRGTIYPAYIFDETSTVQFEQYSFPAPSVPSVYLACAYGDYMTLPPPEEQIRYHGFKAYRVSELEG